MKPLLKIVVIVVALLGIGIPSAMFVVDYMTEGEPTTPNAYIKWGNAPFMHDIGWYDLAASYRYVAFSPGVWETRQAHRDSLLARNPAIMIGEYFNVHTISHWMQRAWERTGNKTMGGRLWGALHEHRAVSTTGGEASLFREQPLFDFFDPEVRTIAINIVVQNAINSNLDWLFLDFFSRILPDWSGPRDIDMDRDGIPHDADADEQKELYGVWFAYINELRAALPPGIELIVNGNLAMRDNEFASLVDGVWVEAFPQFGFGDDGLSNAIDPEYPYSLYYLTADRYRNGRGVVFLGAPTYFDWSHVAEEFDGCGVGHHQTGVVLPPMGSQ